MSLLLYTESLCCEASRNFINFKINKLKNNNFDMNISVHGFPFEIFLENLLSVSNEHLFTRKILLNKILLLQ